MADRYAVDPDFADYVRARQHALLRAAYLVCGDRQLAEDLLQEAFVKLAARWPRLRGEYPDAYVRQILYRDAISAWRRRRREVVGLPAGPHDPGAVPAGTGAGPDGVVDRVDLERALGRLTGRQRAVLVLRFVEDRSVEETAGILGVSAGTVKSQTHAALQRLRELVPDLTEGSGGGAPPSPEPTSSIGGAP